MSPCWRAGVGVLVMVMVMVMVLVEPSEHEQAPPNVLRQPPR